MLKHGQIKFTKKAAQFAEEYFKKKKIESFLVAIKRGEQKPSGYSGLYKQLLGEKQDPSSTYKVYTNDIQKAKKLFETSLIKEGRLSCILSPGFDCLLYLSQDQQDKFKKIILPDTNFPEGLLNGASLPVNGAIYNNQSSVTATPSGKYSQGDTSNTSTLQPYITCYMWKRTA